MARKTMVPSEQKWKDKSGVWLTAFACEELYGFDTATVSIWRRKNCTALNRPIRAKQVYRFPKGNQKIWVYSQADFETIQSTRIKVSKAKKSKESRWLNVSEVAAEFGFSSSTIYQWSTSGCAALNGKLLLTRSELRLCRFSMMRVKVWARSDLETIRQHQVNHTKSKNWLTVQDAHKQFRLHSPMLYQWRKICPTLGRPLRARISPALTLEGQIRNIWHFHRNDLEQIQRLLDNATADVQDPEWITGAEAKTNFGTSTDQLRTLRNRKSAALGGTTLRSKLESRTLIRNEVARSCSIRLYSKLDLETILGSNFLIGKPENLGVWIHNSDVPNCFGISTGILRLWQYNDNCPLLGRPIRSEKFLSRNSRGDIAMLRYYHAEDLESVRAMRKMESNWLPLWKASIKLGVPRSTLKSWRISYCPPLGRRIRSKEMCVPAINGYIQKQACFDCEDIDQILHICDGVARTNGNPIRRGEWLTESEVECEFGFQKRKLFRWKTIGCPPLKGALLRSNFVDLRSRPSEKKRVRRRAYHRDDLEAIQKAFAQEVSGRWIPSSRVLAEYGFCNSTLHYWRRSRCSALKRKIRARKRRSCSRNLLVWYYDRKDLDRILQTVGESESASSIESALATNEEAPCKSKTPKTCQTPQLDAAPNIREPEFRIDCVQLFGSAEPPVIDGKQKAPLTASEYDVIRALIEAHNNGEKLTMQKLLNRSRVGSARQVFYGMRKRDPDWHSVLHPSGSKRLGYRIG